jgi:capping protein beta
MYDCGLVLKFSFVDQITASLSLMRRLPPNKIEQNLNGLLNLIPEETDELLQRVDQPLKEGTDPDTVRKWCHRKMLIRYMM